MPPAPLTPADELRVTAMRRLGIRMPARALRAARAAGLPLPMACALLVKETGGGRNVFAAGDQGPIARRFAGKTVTKALYEDYKRRRGPRGQNGMTGVGPVQLTYWAFQDRADALGGCWRPEINMRVGFELLRDYIRRYGIEKGFAAYNGTGARAQAYGRDALRLYRHFQLELRDLPHPAPEPDQDAIAGTHFTWAEALERSWYQTLPARLRPAVIRHAKNLEKLRARINVERRRRRIPETGIRILSWVRSPAKNDAVDGAPQSRHLAGDATDIALEEIQRLCPWPGGRADFDRYCDLVFAHGGVGTYPLGNRHCDSRGRRARWTSWTR